MPSIKNYIIDNPFKLRSQSPLNFTPDTKLVEVKSKVIGKTGGEKAGKGSTVGTGVDTNQWNIDVKAAEEKNNTNGYQGADNLKKEIDESKSAPREANFMLKNKIEHSKNIAQKARLQVKLKRKEERQKKRADRIYKRNPDLFDPRTQGEFNAMESSAAEADKMVDNTDDYNIMSGDDGKSDFSYRMGWGALEDINNELQTKFNLAANEQLEGGIATPPPSTFSKEEKERFKNRNKTVISSSDAGDSGESGKFVKAPEIPITGLTSSNELIKPPSNYPSSEPSNKEPVKPEFGTNEYYIQGFKNFFKKGPQKPNALSDHARLAQEAKAKGMSQFEYANWKRNNSPNKYNSPMKMQGAGINIPSRQSISEDPTITPPGPPQQVTGAVPQTPATPPPTDKPKSTVRTKEQYEQEQSWLATKPMFDVDAHNDAIRNATTDAFGSKVYGPGAQFGTQRMGRDKTLPYDRPVTQQFTNYGNMGMGGVAPVGVNQAVGMRPTIGSQGYAQRGASPTTSAFAYKQKNTKSPLSFGIFNPTGKDIGGFENQQAANKMAMNTNTYNQRSIPTEAETTMNDLQMANAPMGEPWKQHSSFTGTGMGSAVAYKKNKLK